MNQTKQQKRIAFSAVILALFLLLQSFLGYFPLPGMLDVSAAESTVVENYYASLNTSLTGTAFRAQLAKLITQTHTKQTTYAGLADVYKVADADPDKPGNILWFYTGTSVPFSGSFSGGTNREHVWPKNGGSAFPETSKAGSDGHHLRPTDQQLNSSRGSKSFGEVTKTAGHIVKQNGSTSYGNLCYTDGTFFYPGEGYRGATARILMYVQVRWGDEFELKFVDAAGNNKTIGKISDLLKWHLEEPPTEEEIRRNQAVYEIQGNRNPFIDHPEFATQIYCYDGESYNAKLQQIADQYGSGTPDIESITFDRSALTLTAGQSVTLNPVIAPSNAAGELVWTVSDPTVATVKNGVVTALKNGSVTVTAASAKNSGIRASVSVRVRSISSLSLSGTPEKISYTAGEQFDPAGLTVTAVYSDGSTEIIPNSDCAWLDGATGNAALSAGSTSVICRVGDLEKTIKGITTEEASEVSVSITRSDFNGSGGYAWTQWSDGGLTGQAYIYPGNSAALQFNSSKESRHFYNTAAVPSNILSITVRVAADSNGKVTPKKWELRTSPTPFGQGIPYPETGTSHGVQTVTAEGTTWTLNTTDRYFTLNYVDTGAVYLQEIVITYGASSSGGNTEHQFGEWIAEVPATCTATGTRGHYVCTHCNGYFDASYNLIADITVPMNAHKPGEWIVDSIATCTTSGAQHRECGICHTVTETVTVEPVAHIFGAWLTDTAATCSVPGSRHRECSVCHHTETGSVPKTAHTPVTDPAVEATCVKTGLHEGSHCAVCNTVLVPQTVATKRAHTPGEWEVDADGRRHKDCTVCGKVLEGEKMPEPPVDTDVNGTDPSGSQPLPDDSAPETSSGSTNTGGCAMAIGGESFSLILLIAMLAYFAKAGSRKKNK